MIIMIIIMNLISKFIFTGQAVSGSNYITFIFEVPVPNVP
jgi:hypothetical protein